MSVDGDDYSDTSSDEDDIDVHFLAREGTVDDMEWALFKDRNRLLNLKELKTGYSALHCACEMGRKDMVVCLIKKGAIVDFRDAKFRTPLMITSNKGFTDIARLLLEKGSDIKCKDRECWTCLHHATENSHLETCTMLIKRGVDLSAEEARFGRTALHFAAELGLAGLADMLIVRGSDLYGSGDSIYSKTPLHLACLNGHHDVADVLIKRGIDLETTCGFLDMTALHCACEKGHLGCVQVLVEAGADMGALGFTFNGSTPLHLAAGKGHEEICYYLANKGASLTVQGKYTTEGTALHVACQFGTTKVVRILVDAGADIEMRDMNGNTGMHTACKHSQFEVALQLISMGADLTAVAGNARFPLELIPPHESYRREEMRLAGLNYDAEMERKAAEAAKAIADAESLAAARQRAEDEAFRRAEVLRMELEKRQARFCALLMACCNISGELSALTDIIAEYPDLDINIPLEADRGSRALVRAAFNGFNVIVEALLRWKGIDINVQEKDGNTALHMAASRGKLQHKLVVEMLLFARVRTGIPNRAGKLASTIASTPYLAEVIRDPRLLHPSLASMTAVAASTIVHLNQTSGESRQSMIGFNFPEQDEGLSLGGSTVLDNPVGVLSDPAQGLMQAAEAGPAPGIDAGDSIALSLGATQIMNKERRDGTTPYITFGAGSLEDFTRFSKGIDMNTGKAWAVHPVAALPRPSSPLPLKGDDGSVGGLSMDSHMGDPGNTTSLIGGDNNNIYSPGTGVFPAIPASQQPQSQTRKGMPESSFQEEKFGPAPLHYRPCTADMFYRKYQSQNNGVVTTSSVLALPDRVMEERAMLSHEGSLLSSSVEEKAGSIIEEGDLFPVDAPGGGGGVTMGMVDGRSTHAHTTNISRFPLQASHTPSSFDSTEEWAEVKDYLWLLGYPYSKAFALGQARAGLPLGMQGKGTHRQGSTNNLYSANAYQQQQLHRTQSATEVEIMDPRAKLHSLAIIMDDAQEAFSDPATGGYHIDYDAQGQALLQEFSKAEGHKEGGDVKLKHFSFDFVQQAVQLYWPKGVDEGSASFRGKGGVKAMLRHRISAMTESRRISEDVKSMLLALLDLSMAKGQQEVITEKLKREIEGMHGEDKPGVEVDSKSSCTVSYTPRQRRRLIDAMYDLASVFKARAEKDFPADNVRTRFWVSATSGKYAETIKYDLSFDLMLWLKDLHLESYYENFDYLGFRLLSDFDELSLDDCKEYFPFLRIGDAVRLSKAIRHLHPVTVTAYRERATKKEIAVALPPIPT